MRDAVQRVANTDAGLKLSSKQVEAEQEETRTHGRQQHYGLAYDIFSAETGLLTDCHRGRRPRPTSAPSSCRAARAAARLTPLTAGRGRVRGTARRITSDGGSTGQSRGSTAARTALLVWWIRVPLANGHGGQRI